MSKFTKGKWEITKKFDVVCNGKFIAAICFPSYAENDIYKNTTVQANARLIAAAPEMYEMITKLVDGITIAELLNGIQIVKVNPVLIESAKRLLAEIDGEEIKA